MNRQQEHEAEIKRIFKEFENHLLIGMTIITVVITVISVLILKCAM